MKPIPSVFQWANPVTSWRGMSVTKIATIKFNLKTETGLSIRHVEQKFNKIKVVLLDFKSSDIS